MSFSADWFSKNIPNWELWLKDFKGKPNLNFLEIGCYEGRATIWLLQNILTDPSSQITVIDTFESSELYQGDIFKNFCDNTRGYWDRIDVLRGMSKDLLKTMYQPIDFVYIDGSHKADDVYKDAELSWAILKPEGIMVFDDFKLRRYPIPTLNPYPAINSFMTNYHGKYEEIGRGWQMCLRKL